MGLDVEFYVPSEDEPIVYMRKHWSFFKLIPLSEAEDVYEGCDDFWVDHDLLDQLKKRLEERWRDVAASDRTFTEDEVRNILSDEETRTPTTILKALYLQILRELRDAVDEHGPLICAWSA